MAVQPGYRRRRRIGLHEAPVAMGKSHHEEMDLPLHAGDVRLGFPKIRLRMAGRVRQWHEHLPPTTAVFANVVLDDGLPALEAMLVTKTLTDPLGGVPLLLGTRQILFQDAVDDVRERIQLRPLRRLAAPVARRNRVRQDLRHRPSINPKSPRRLMPAQALMATGKSDLPIKLHRVHPPAFHPDYERLSNGGFSLRPQPDKPAASVVYFCSADYIHGAASLGFCRLLYGKIA